MMTRVNFYEFNLYMNFVIFPKIVIFKNDIISNATNNNFYFDFYLTLGDKLYPGYSRISAGLLLAIITAGKVFKN